MSQYISILNGKPVDQCNMLPRPNPNQVCVPLVRQRAAVELTVERDHFYWAAFTGNLDNLPPMSANLTLEYMKIFNWPYHTTDFKALPRKIAVYDDTPVEVDPDDGLYIIVPNIRKPAETRDEFNKMYGVLRPQRIRILKSEISTNYPWLKSFIHEKHWNPNYSE